MEKKILSVTVPAYNAQDYLKKCLDSFLIDDEELFNMLEILVINDGSTDDTSIIAKEYEDRYPQVFKLINKENGGHGSGINAGIKNATGLYFKVVDADDWVDKYSLKKLLELISNMRDSKPDIIASDFVTVLDGEFTQIKVWRATHDRTQYGKIIEFSSGEVKECIKMHSMTIFTEILKNMGMRIDENLYYVDAEYITFPIPYVNSVYYDPHILYQYRLGRKGQTMDIDIMKKNCSQHRFVLERLIEYYDNSEKGMDLQHKKYMEITIGKMIESHFQIFICMGTNKDAIKELREWDCDLITKHPEFIKSTSKRSIQLIRKTNYIILPIGKLIYKILKKL